jgi:hypothetical protein
MFCCDSSGAEQGSHLFAGGDQRLDKRHINLRLQPNTRLGQRSAPDDDPFCPCITGIHTGLQQSGVQSCRIGQQRLRRTSGHETAKIRARPPMGLHQRVNRRAKLRGCCGHGKSRAVLGGRTRGSGTDSYDGTRQTGRQTLRARIAEGRDNHGARFGQNSAANLIGCSGQCRWLGDHRGRVCVGPSPHNGQVPPHDGHHRISRLRRAVRIDHKNRFHKQRYHP